MHVRPSSLTILRNIDASSVIIWNALALGLVGMTVGGPYALIIGTVSADLGQRSTLTGNPAALGTVTGLIDGTGSIGSAIGQVITLMDLCQSSVV